MIPIPSSGRFQFSGHETFPLRQLWLHKAVNAVDSQNADARSAFADDDAVVRFGVGKNMVTSIRHWASACNVITEDDERGGYVATEHIGHTIFAKDGLDPYCEYPATAWLMHWFVASTSDKTTTWYYLFNHVLQQSFDREAIVSALWRVLDELAASTPTLKRISLATLKRDVECCIRSYVPRLSSESPEEMSEPLLGELGLIQQNAKGSFEFRRGSKRSLPDGIFAYALLDYWKRQQAGSVMAFDRVAHDYGSPGRVFKLDEDAVADRLMALEELTEGDIQWTEQAGIRQVTRRGAALNAIDGTMNKVLRAAYGKR
jgi:hypothetical protein